MCYTELGDSKYRPCPLSEEYVDAGWLGRKSGPRVLRVLRNAKTDFPLLSEMPRGKCAGSGLLFALWYAADDRRRVDSARFEAAEQSVSTDEHLLERISIVENRLTRLTERLERSLDLLLRQAQNSYFDRSLIKTLINILSDDGVVESARLEQLWNEQMEQDAIEQRETAYLDELRLKILAAPPASESKVFAALVGEGFLAMKNATPRLVSISCSGPRK